MLSVKSLRVCVCVSIELRAGINAQSRRSDPLIRVRQGAVLGVMAGGGMSVELSGTVPPL